MQGQNSIKNRPFTISSNQENVSDTFSLIFALCGRYGPHIYIPIICYNVPHNFYQYKIEKFIYVVHIQHKETSSKNPFKYIMREKMLNYFVDTCTKEINNKLFFVLDEPYKHFIENVSILISYRRFWKILMDANILMAKTEYSEIFFLLFNLMFKPFVVDFTTDFKAIERSNILKILEEYYAFIITTFCIFCELYNIAYNKTTSLKLSSKFVIQVYNYLIYNDKNVQFNFTKYLISFGFHKKSKAIKIKLETLYTKFNNQIKEIEDKELSYISCLMKQVYKTNRISEFVHSLEAAVNINSAQIAGTLGMRHSISRGDSISNVSSKIIKKLLNYVYLSRFHVTEKYTQNINIYIKNSIEQIISIPIFSHLSLLLKQCFNRLQEIAQTDKITLLENKKLKFNSNSIQLKKLYKICNDYQHNVVTNSCYQNYGLFLEMGLGKTLISLIEMTKYSDQIDHYIIILPLQLKRYWQEEMKKHNTMFLLQKIIFLTYSALSKYSVITVDKIYQEYKHSNIMFILDESTYAKNPEANRTENIHFLLLLFRIRKKYHTILRLLTGTPYSNKASQIRGQMLLLNPFVTPTLKVFKDICKKSIMLGTKKEISLYDTVEIVSNKYTENTTNKNLKANKVHEAIYTLKYFFNYYFVCIDKKSVGLNIIVNEKTININNKDHSYYLEELSEHYSNTLRENILKTQYKDDTINKTTALQQWTSQHTEYIKYNYFFPLYYFASGGVTESIIKYLNDKKINIEPYKKAAKERIRNLIETILHKHKKFIYVSMCIDILNKVSEILEKLKISYNIIIGETKIKDRQTIINNYNNNKFDVLIASINCLAYGFSIYATNTIIINEPMLQIEIYEQLKNRIMRIDSKFKAVNIYTACTGNIHKKIRKGLQENKSIIELFNNIAKEVLKA